MSKIESRESGAKPTKLDEIKARNGRADSDSNLSQAIQDRRYLLELNAQLVEALLMAEKTFMVYMHLPTDRYPGPPTSALQTVRATLAKVEK